MKTSCFSLEMIHCKYTSQNIKSTRRRILSSTLFTPPGKHVNINLISWTHTQQKANFPVCWWLDGSITNMFPILSFASCHLYTICLLRSSFSCPCCCLLFPFIAFFSFSSSPRSIPLSPPLCFVPCCSWDYVLGLSVMLGSLVLRSPACSVFTWGIE